MSEQSTDLVTPSPPSITTPQRQRWDAGTVNLIRAQTVPADANDAEFAQFLEVAARYELDPLMKEIWALRLKSGNPIQSVVAKDGLLKIANRYTGPGWANQPGEFLGCTSGAVHHDDVYKRDRYVREDGTIGVLVQHGPAKERFGGADMSERGELVGAWAVCRRRGHDDIFYEAPRKEYDKKQNAWGTHPHAMLCKVAEAMVLRKAFPIAGVVGEGEVDRVATPVTAPGEQDAPPPVEEWAWPEDEQQTEDLKQAFKLLGYRKAKVRAVLAAAAQEEGGYEKLLADLHAEADDGIADAEVVDA